MRKSSLYDYLIGNSYYVNRFLSLFEVIKIGDTCAYTVCARGAHDDKVEWEHAQICP